MKQKASKLQSDIQTQEKLKRERIDEVKSDIERLRSTVKMVDMNLIRSTAKQR